MLRTGAPSQLLPVSGRPLEARGTCPVKLQLWAPGVLPARKAGAWVGTRMVGGWVLALLLGDLGPTPCRARLLLPASQGPEVRVPEAAPPRA